MCPCNDTGFSHVMLMRAHITISTASCGRPLERAAVKDSKIYCTVYPYHDTSLKTLNS
jgi:hypothetical protein